MSNEEGEIRPELRVLEHADQSGDIRLTCRYFGIPRSLFYVWRGKYRTRGRAGLARQKAVGAVYPTAIAPEVVEKSFTCAARTTSGRSGSSGTWSATTAFGSPMPASSAFADAMG